MKKSSSLLFAVTAITLSMLGGCAQEREEAAEVAAEAPSEPELVEYLFVQHADSATLQDGILTLNGIGKSVLYFSDRPHRIVGRESLQRFLAAWDMGEDSFRVTPPNAVLTVVKEDGARDLAVVLTDPSMPDENTLVYTVEVLDGPQSGSSGEAALFIDAFGSPKRGGESELGRPGGLGGPKRGGESELGKPGGIGDPIPGAETRLGDPGGIGDPIPGAEVGRPGEPGVVERFVGDAEDGLDAFERKARDGARFIDRGIDSLF